ncbi:MAG: hypothetical protein A2X68_10700 [Ignavibacteria bacterium GWC2_56_12]|nr:MAG: hypothetical protein A2X68_10700 [Ignavibacteria bacterium GWC2_56_12]
MKQNWKIFLIAPVLGLMAMILPVLLNRPVHWYDSPLFPVIRNAQENIGVTEFVLLLVVGFVLGHVSRMPALLLGGAAVILLPFAALAEMVADPTSHNLWPLEFMFYAFYGAVAAAGAGLAHLTSKWFMQDSSGA